MVEFFNLVQIALVDLSLAGDNAIIIGMAVATLPAHSRKRAMVFGIGAATLLRILLAFFAVRLLEITGLLAAGGLLLLWVGWKMERDIRHQRSLTAPQSQIKRTRDAVWQIIIADVSMSLDNVLGVAGIARDHTRDLIAGLILSVALMGFASSYIARLTERYPRIGYIGVLIVVYTASRMIYDGLLDLKWI